MRATGVWLDERADVLLRATVGGAVLLLLAYPASKLADDLLTEDPTGYRGLTLCGLAAAVAIAVGWWREGGRVAAVAALAAAAVFSFAAYAEGSHWYAIASGALGYGPFQPSPLLPFFAAVAVAGAALAVALAAAWWPRADVHAR